MSEDHFSKMMAAERSGDRVAQARSWLSFMGGGSGRPTAEMVRGLIVKIEHLEACLKECEVALKRLASSAGVPDEGPSENVDGALALIADLRSHRDDAEAQLRRLSKAFDIPFDAGPAGIANALMNRYGVLEW